MTNLEKVEFQTDDYNSAMQPSFIKNSLPLNWNNPFFVTHMIILHLLSSLLDCKCFKSRDHILRIFVSSASGKHLAGHRGRPCSVSVCWVKKINKNIQTSLKVSIVNAGEFNKIFNSLASTCTHPPHTIFQEKGEHSSWSGLMNVLWTTAESIYKS